MLQSRSLNDHVGTAGFEQSVHQRPLAGSGAEESGQHGHSVGRARPHHEMIARVDKFQLGPGTKSVAATHLCG